MNNFSYTRVSDVASAVREIAADTTAKFIAGGTNLVDLMKENVARPGRLIDITRLPLNKIEATEDGGLRLGALVKNADTAYDETVRARYPLLSKAILAGASAQLRNMATNGGSLMQRTRCYCFYDTATPCNKREPAAGCSALDGFNRIHAILGASDQCIATHMSDGCVALAALEASVQVQSSEGQRQIPFAKFHRLPGDTPQIDNTLQPYEMITSIDLPPKSFAGNYCYLKLRDRASYAFALVSVAAALEMDGDRISTARLALGGVAHKPWRDGEAEEILNGKPASLKNFQQAAAAVVRNAKGYGENDFKIELAQHAIVRALQLAVSMEQPA